MPKHIFLDDHVIAESVGLTRTMHKPGNRRLVLKADRPSDGENITTASAPMWIPEENRYRMIYEVRGVKGRYKEKAYGIAVSDDGLTWEKPDLGIVQHEGKDTNWYPTPGDYRLWHVIHDPDDTDERRRYKGLLKVDGSNPSGGFTTSGHQPVTSPDGHHWEKVDCPILPSGDAGTLTYDRSRRQFMALMKYQGPNGRAYNLSTSEDYVNWSPLAHLFGTDDQDQRDAIDVIRKRIANPALAKPILVEPDPTQGFTRPADYKDPVWRAECYNIGLFPFEGVYIAILMMFYPTGQSLPTRRNTDGFHLLQLGMTRDLKTWERLGNREPFIGPSPLTNGLVGNYDRLQLQPTNVPIDTGDRLLFYYEGMKRRLPQHDIWTDGSPRDPSTLSPEERADWLEDTHTGIYVVDLRKDGFVSLDASEEGTLLTEPVTLSGDHVMVNANASDGRILVEILDEASLPIEGFAGENAPSISEDGVSLAVRFDGQNDISSLTGRPIRLRFTMQNASLFSFWSE